MCIFPAVLAAGSSSKFIPLTICIALYRRSTYIACDWSMRDPGLLLAGHVYIALPYWSMVLTCIQ